jgi:hypothetical protein
MKSEVSEKSKFGHHPDALIDAQIELDRLEAHLHLAVAVLNRVLDLNVVSPRALRIKGNVRWALGEITDDGKMKAVGIALHPEPNERAERREEPELPREECNHSHRFLCAIGWKCSSCGDVEARDKPAAPAINAVQEALRIYDCTDLYPIGAMTAALRAYSERLRETAREVALDKWQMSANEIDELTGVLKDTEKRLFGPGGA